jgi:hypothetical protein
MITKITVINKDKDHYLYDIEKNIILSMLNNNELKREYNKAKKCFKIVKIGKNTATVRIYKITDKFFFLKDYILLTTLNIKFN